MTIGFEAVLKNKYSYLNSVWKEELNPFTEIIPGIDAVKLYSKIFYVSSLCISDVLTAFPLWHWSNPDVDNIIFVVVIFKKKDMLKKSDRDFFVFGICVQSLWLLQYAFVWVCFLWLQKWRHQLKYFIFTALTVLCVVAAYHLHFPLCHL